MELWYTLQDVFLRYIFFILKMFLLNSMSHKSSIALRRYKVHCNKTVSDIPVPSRDGGWAGIIKLFLARESLISDIPAGDGMSSCR